MHFQIVRPPEQAVLPALQVRVPNHSSSWPEFADFLKALTSAARASQSEISKVRAKRPRLPAIRKIRTSIFPRRRACRSAAVFRNPITWASSAPPIMGPYRWYNRSSSFLPLLPFRILFRLVAPCYALEIGRKIRRRRENDIRDFREEMREARAG